MNIKTPYLLFLGDAIHAKTAQGVRDWRPEQCLGQLRFSASRLDVGLPELSLEEATARGVRTLLIGAAPAGGALPDHWIGTLLQALELGMDIASGLHAKLIDVPALKAAAARLGRQLHDVRYPNQSFDIGAFAPRSGKRLLTVGTDCAVGKMYTSLSIEREMRSRGIHADFRATGQTGILIAGKGVSVDAVVSDFVSAAAAWLSPDNDPDHWDLIEGQGSLFHPAYAGVTLGLVHGSQPDAMVLCSDPTRTMLGDFDLYPQPTLAACIDAYTAAARLTNPQASVVGISLNTSKLDESAAIRLLADTQERLGLPCVDPFRIGVKPIVDAVAGEAA